MTAAPMGWAWEQHLREGRILKVAFVLTTSYHHLRKANSANDMQVLQDRVIADNLLICLWQQEKLPTVVAQSSFHHALQRHCRPPGPLLTASLGGWSQDRDTEGRELTASSLPP